MNTVTISTERFLELIEKEKVADAPRKHTVIIESWYLSGRTIVKTDNDEVNVLAERLKSQVELTQHFIEENSRLRAELNKETFWQWLLGTKKRRGLPDYKNPPPPIK